MNLLVSLQHTTISASDQTDSSFYTKKITIKKSKSLVLGPEAEFNKYTC